MKRILLSAVVLIAAVVFVVLTTGASNGNVTGTYKIQLDNAFGLVTGAAFKVAGVPAGSIKKIDLDPSCIKGGGNSTCYAVVTVSVTQKGFGQFHSDAFCQSRPQSLIGEYFIECEPGTKGKVLKPGSMIPVQNTQSTIPADLLQDVMQMPYRERFTLIINELGAAVAGRSGDLQAALQRAVPALTQTDNLLNLLGNDSKNIEALTASSNSVITALANNSTQVNRFIVEAGNAARDTSTQNANLQSSLQQFPGFLEQLKPAMQKLGATADANDPVLTNLNQASGQLKTLFTNLAPCSSPHTGDECGFATAALPAIKALGKASVPGRTAAIAAEPTVKDLNTFSKPVPELAQNLEIVLNDLNNPNRSVEPDSRSPGGKGFSGLEALLWYGFIQPLSLNNYTEYGHILSVNAFISPQCSPYATPASIAQGLKQYGSSYRQCYAWLGKNQPGVNETDPSNPSACVPDPGGATPGQTGPKTTACKLNAPATQPPPPSASADVSGANTSATKSPSGTGSKSSGSGSGGGSSGVGVSQALGNIFAALEGGSGSSAGTSQSSTPASSTSSEPGQAKQLLNYLLAP